MAPSKAQIKREPSLRGVFDPRVADWYTQVSTSLKRGPLLLFTRVNTEVYGPRREATWHRKSRGTCNTPHTSRLTPGGHSHTVTELASGPRLRETACSPTTLPSGRRARARRPGGSRSRNGPRPARARWVPPRTRSGSLRLSSVRQCDRPGGLRALARITPAAQHTLAASQPATPDH